MHRQPNIGNLIFICRQGRQSGRCHKTSDVVPKKMKMLLLPESNAEWCKLLHYLVFICLFFLFWCLHRHLCNLPGLLSKFDELIIWITNFTSWKKTSQNCSECQNDVMTSHGDGCLQTWKKTSHTDTSNLRLTIYFCTYERRVDGGDAGGGSGEGWGLNRWK